MFIAENDEGVMIGLFGNLAGSIMQLLAFSKAGEAGGELERAASEMKRLE
tara:strand:+ start:2024 stop:2173 length:150 start_codon:yes stop_codon:yes gene_type:complete